MPGQRATTQNAAYDFFRSESVVPLQPLSFPAAQKRRPTDAACAPPRPAAPRAVTPALIRDLPAAYQPRAHVVQKAARAVGVAQSVLDRGRKHGSETYANLIASTPVDLSHVSAGPRANDVAFGANCGSCTLFLALDDKRREDPAFMEAYLSGSHFCPVAVPELIKSKTPLRHLVRADHKACTHFQHSSIHAGDNFTDVFSKLRCLTLGELEVIALSMNSVIKEKTLEEKLGYKVGQIVNVSVNGVPTKGRVVGLRRASLLVSTRYNGKEHIIRVTPGSDLCLS